MISNPIQFAVVREDPEIETVLLRERPGAKRILLIGSGGCTALTLAARFPDIEITVLEPNTAQVNLIQRKIQALRSLNASERRKVFGIGTSEPVALTFSGNFESLFKSLREFLFEFVMGRERWVELFAAAVREGSRADSPANLPAASVAAVARAKYWPVAFELFFSDPLLLAMFGPEATQYAAPGSYPAYFRKAFERGLLASQAATNYFLHHVFLGHYIDRAECLPAYLVEAVPARYRLNFAQSTAQDYASYGEFDLISLSNIFDWTRRSEVATLADRLGKEMKPGASVVFRQLNNDDDFTSLFGAGVKFDSGLSKRLLDSDRSLFYSALHVARKD